MQTFLAYPDFVKSAEVLDNKRLGKQRVEAYQILNTLTGKGKGWSNHPAVKMWKGYEKALALYGYYVCAEWRQRGFKDSLMAKFMEFLVDNEALPPTKKSIPMPKWIGDFFFHLSHRANLNRKDPNHYKFFAPKWLGYKWPTV